MEKCFIYRHLIWLSLFLAQASLKGKEYPLIIYSKPTILNKNNKELDNLLVNKALESVNCSGANNIILLPTNPKFSEAVDTWERNFIMNSRLGKETRELHALQANRILSNIIKILAELDNFKPIEQNHFTYLHYSCT